MVDAHIQSCSHAILFPTLRALTYNPAPGRILPPGRTFCLRGGNVQQGCPPLEDPPITNHTFSDGPRVQDCNLSRYQQADSGQLLICAFKTCGNTRRLFLFVAALGGASGNFGGTSSELRWEPRDGPPSRGAAQCRKNHPKKICSFPHKC